VLLQTEKCKKFSDITKIKIGDIISGPETEGTNEDKVRGSSKNPDMRPAEVTPSGRGTIVRNYRNRGVIVV
jgi:hypothetical protein